MYGAVCCANAAMCSPTPKRRRTGHWRTSVPVRNCNLEVRNLGNATCALTGLCHWPDKKLRRNRAIDVHHICGGDCYPLGRAHIDNGILLYNPIHMLYHNVFIGRRNQHLVNGKTLIAFVDLLLLKAAENSSCEYGQLGKLIDPMLVPSFKEKALNADIQFKGD